MRLTKAPKVMTATALATVILSISGCGTKINTGRNSDPGNWPKGTSNPTDTGDSGNGGTPTQGCFSLQVTELDPAIKTFCAEHINKQPELASLAGIICEKKLLTGLLKKTGCGWTGDKAKVMGYVHRFDIQTDRSKDYEDIVGSATHAPVTPEKFATPIMLAFENYAEFKSKGFQWVDGTREMTNQSGGTALSGLTYRFRAEKPEYEVGYKGRVQFYQLTPDLIAHINVATGDYARIIAFEQIAFYQRLPDQTTMTVRLEHRKVSSQGLFDLAKRSATEMSRDTMEKGFSNATK
jgi:hypothetical protein